MTRLSPPARGQQSFFRDARESQTHHVMFAIPGVFERVHLAKALYREVRLDLRQFFNIRPGLVASSEMTERSNQWLVAVNEVRTYLHGSPTNDHRLLII